MDSKATLHKSYTNPSPRAGLDSFIHCLTRRRWWVHIWTRSDMWREPCHALWWMEGDMGRLSGSVSLIQLSRPRKKTQELPARSHHHRHSFADTVERYFMIVRSLARSFFYCLLVRKVTRINSNTFFVCEFWRTNEYWELLAGWSVKSVGWHAWHHCYK